MKKISFDKHIQVFIERIESDSVVVELSDGNLLEIPRDFLPDFSFEGQVYDIFIKRNPSEEEYRRDNLKRIQKELEKGT